MNTAKADADASDNSTPDSPKPEAPSAVTLLKLWLKQLRWKQSAQEFHLFRSFTFFRKIFRTELIQSVRSLLRRILHDFERRLRA